MSDDAAERLSRLLGLKLRTLVRDHLDDDTVGEPVGFPPGAALMHGSDMWFFLEHEPERGLGPALARAVRAGAKSVHLVAERDTGVLARRAEEFTISVSVWHAAGRSLLPAVAEGVVAPAAVADHHEALRPLIVAGGAEPQVEHGVLFGDVRGLEVCRVVDDSDIGSTRLEVGVGAHDREAFQMLHGDVPTAESLKRIVDVVGSHRRPDAPQHPLNRLAAERFVRWQVIETPELVGAVSMEVAQPPVVRRNLKDAVPCVAHGVDDAGASVVVVCSAGVDLDVVPYAADARLAAEAAEPGVAGGPRVVVVTPKRDRVPVTTELAGLLHRPVEFVAVG